MGDFSGMGRTQPAKEVRRLYGDSYVVPTVPGNGTKDKGSEADEAPEPEVDVPPSAALAERAARPGDVGEFVFSNATVDGAADRYFLRRAYGKRGLRGGPKPAEWLYRDARAIREAKERKERERDDARAKVEQEREAAAHAAHAAHVAEVRRTFTVTVEGNQAKDEMWDLYGRWHARRPKKWPRAKTRPAVAKEKWRPPRMAGRAAEAAPP